MNELFLVSYAILWVIAVVTCTILAGALRQLGRLQHDIIQEPRPSPSELALSANEDGPPIGSQIPTLILETANGFGTISLDRSQPRNHATLIVFMSALCESCQHLVDPLNLVARQHGGDVQPIVIMQDEEHACRAFLRVFAVAVPLVCDADRAAIAAFQARQASFALLYDAGGTLLRKGSLDTSEDLETLVHGMPHSVPALSSPAISPVA